MLRDQLGAQVEGVSSLKLKAGSKTRSPNDVVQTVATIPEVQGVPVDAVRIDEKSPVVRGEVKTDDEEMV